MKRWAHFLCAPFLVFLVACGDSRTESEGQTTGASSENAGTAEGTQSSAGRAKNEEQRAMEGELGKFGHRLEALKAQAGKLGGRAKAELEGLIQEVEKKMAVAEKRLEEFKSASAEAWREAKSKTDSALKDLEESYDRAISRLKEST